MQHWRHETLSNQNEAMEQTDERATLQKRMRRPQGRTREPSLHKSDCLKRSISTPILLSQCQLSQATLWLSYFACLPQEKSKRGKKRREPASALAGDFVRAASLQVEQILFKGVHMNIKFGSDPLKAHEKPVHRCSQEKSHVSLLGTYLTAGSGAHAESTKCRKKETRARVTAPQNN